MDINEFLTQVVFPALATILTTAITLFVAIQERRQKKKEIADEEKATEQKKAEIIKTCIQAVEQMHKGLEGAKKLAACIDGARQMLSTAGIEVSDFELKMRIESQLAEFNKIFESEAKE
jgi:hypothetical protein